MDNDNSIGVLYRLTPGWPLTAQLRVGKSNFARAAHAGLAGHLPVHARLHPNDLPGDILECENLLLLPDESVQPGYVRITTASASDEFAAERDFLGQQQGETP
jgi:hypothetical protein